MPKAPHAAKKVKGERKDAHISGTLNEINDKKIKASKGKKT